MQNLTVRTEEGKKITDTFPRPEIDLDFEQLEKDLAKEHKKSVVDSILADARRNPAKYVKGYDVGRGAE